MSDTLKTCESNTPETDNFIVSAGYVRTDHQWRTFARKLESERNSLQDQRDFAMGEIERLRKERDKFEHALRVIARMDTSRANTRALLSVAVAKDALGLETPEH